MDDSKPAAKLTAEEFAQQTAEWRARMLDLIAKIEARAYLGRPCTLTPATAIDAAVGLRIYIAAPTREELCHLFCRMTPQCHPVCSNRCLELANQIHRLYHEAIPPWMPKIKRWP